MQYTIRGVPPEVDRALRERARSRGQSLNEAALEALTDGVGLAEQPRKRRDLSDLVGTITWEDEVLEALADQDKVDPEMWQ